MRSSISETRSRSISNRFSICSGDLPWAESSVVRRAMSARISARRRFAAFRSRGDLIRVAIILSVQVDSQDTFGEACVRALSKGLCEGEFAVVASFDSRRFAEFRKQ